MQAILSFKILLILKFRFAKKIGFELRLNTGLVRHGGIGEKPHRIYRQTK